MSPIDFSMIEKDLTFVTLLRQQALNSPDEIIKHCWFIETGVVSVVAISPKGHETEVGIVGRDGMIDIAVTMSRNRSPLHSFIQIAGTGYRMPSSALARARDASPTFRAQLNNYAYDYFLQVAYTALANASLNVEERLARWMLMCGDRVGDSEILLTHEFISTMLNVRRAGVTVAIQSLENRGFMTARRGVLSIIDRAGLTRFAKDVYLPFN